VNLSMLPSEESEDPHAIEEESRIHTESPHCVIHILDEMVMNCVQLCLKDVHGRASAVQTQKQDIFGEHLFFTHQIFQSFQSTTETGARDMTYVRIQVLAVLAPFKDAIDTLTLDSYPTLGLAILVLRRVQSVLNDLKIDELSVSGRIKDESVEDSQGADPDKTKAIVDVFLKTIQKTFATTFKSYVEVNASAQWTIPLDPRLILMNGLSVNEQKKVKDSLSEAVKVLVCKGSFSNDRGITWKGDEAADTPTTSTMGGLFLGDSRDVGSTPMENGEDYSRANVESYFKAVSSHRRIHDSLQWWKNNHTSFPELAVLARKWMATSAVYAGPKLRPNERNAVIPIYCEEEKDIVRAIFLHDNLTHI
jgi:hypothetical protein